MGTVLNAIHDKLVEVGPARRWTVEEPVAVTFGGTDGSGGYVMLEPHKDGRRGLVMDHQFDHKTPVLGQQRVRFDVTPAAFAYVARARALGYGVLARAYRALRFMGVRRVPFTDLGEHNIVFALGDTIRNPNGDYADGLANLEPMCHELVDKMAVLGFVDGVFDGVFTTFRTNHARDVAAMRELIPHLVEVGTEGSDDGPPYRGHPN